MTTHSLSALTMLLSRHTRRREFIAALGGAAAWPLVARAQQTGKSPTIGYLGATTASAQRKWTAAFLQRLRELGWIEGRTVAIEYRWAEGRAERSAELVAELLRLRVDIIVAAGTPATRRGKAGNIDYPHRLRPCGGPARYRPRSEFGAAGWQRHWTVATVY